MRYRWCRDSVFYPQHLAHQSWERVKTRDMSHRRNTLQADIRQYTVAHVPTGAVSENVLANQLFRPNELPESSLSIVVKFLINKDSYSLRWLISWQSFGISSSCYTYSLDWTLHGVSRWELSSIIGFYRPLRNRRTLLFILIVSASTSLRLMSLSAHLIFYLQITADKVRYIIRKITSVSSRYRVLLLWRNKTLIIT